MHDNFDNWLASGSLEPINLKTGSDRHIYMRVAKTAAYDYIYSQRQYKEEGIVRGDPFQYAGVYCKADGLIYDGQYELRSVYDDEDYTSRSAEKLQATLQADVRSRIERVIDNDRANLNITKLTEPRKVSSLEEYIKYSAPGAAREAYLDTVEFEGYTFRCYYEAHRWTEDSLLNYISDPEKYAAREAAQYIETHQEEMLSDFLEGDALTTAYNAILAASGDPVHFIKRIRMAVNASDAKTVNVTIDKDGQSLTFKTEAYPLRVDCGSYYSTYHIVAADRRTFEEAFGRSANFAPEEIVSITYGRKEIYSRGE